MTDDCSKDAKFNFTLVNRIMAFQANFARRIYLKHEAQDISDIDSLKQQYGGQFIVSNSIMVSELVLRLKRVFDVTDHILWDTDQLTHSKQCYYMMRQEGITDPDLLILCFIHDLGKVAALELDEVPENVFCCNTARLEGCAQGCGLENITFDFGHDEICYLRMRNYVSPKVAFCIRYHSARLVPPNAKSYAKLRPYMSQSDLDFLPFMQEFVTYDLKSKKRKFIPPISDAEVVRFVDSYFDKPVQF